MPKEKVFKLYITQEEAEDLIDGGDLFIHLSKINADVIRIIVGEEEKNG